MPKVRYSPPRIHPTHRLELPEHLTRFAEEYEALPEGQDTYDAQRITRMAEDDPRFKGYIEQLVEAVTGLMGGSQPKRGAISQPPSRLAGGGFNNTGSNYAGGPRYGFAQGTNNSFVDDLSRRHTIHIEPDKYGGFYGWFHVTRRFIYGLLVVLFLLFLAIYHVPGVLDFFFDVVT